MPRLDQAWRHTLGKIDEIAPVLESGYPLLTVEGSWKVCERDDWVEGYWAGMLWFAWEVTHEERYLQWARQRSTRLAPRSYDLDTPPLSMVFYPSCVYGYRLTGDPVMRAIALNAARSMTHRFNQQAGFIDITWAPPAEALRAGRTIVDTLLNLSLLWWASKETGDPTFGDMATRSALSALRNHVRPDYSTYHVVYADPETGAPIRYEAGQGYRPDSCWSRGQAWALYGFALAYRETGLPTFLEAAQGTADYYLSHLPEDSIPYWDFQAPGIPDEPRDSSAAAIAVCGLLEIAKCSQGAAEGQRYVEAARAGVQALTQGYTSEGHPGEQGVLLHGVYHRPRSRGVDCALIWGDFYYMKALAHLRRENLW